MQMILNAIANLHALAIHLGEMRGHLPHGQATGSQGQHDLIDAVQPPLALLHDDRLEPAGPVPRHVHPVAGSSRNGACPIVLVIAQVLRELDIQRVSSTVLVRPVNSPPGPINSTPSVLARSTSWAAGTCRF
jgi:hypothetical protein